MHYLTDTKGTRAYFLYLFSNLTWEQVGHAVGSSGSNAWSSAKSFAEGLGQAAWPLRSAHRYAIFKQVGQDDLQDAWVLMTFANGSAAAVAEAIGFEDDVEARKAATEFGLNSGLGLPYDPYVPALLQRYAELMASKELDASEVGCESIH